MREMERASVETSFVWDSNDCPYGVLQRRRGQRCSWNTAARVAKLGHELSGTEHFHYQDHGQSRRAHFGKDRRQRSKWRRDHAVAAGGARMAIDEDRWQLIGNPK